MAFYTGLLTEELQSFYHTDIGQLTEEMQAFYMPEGEACGRANPQQLALLLDRLSTYTDEVVAMAEKEGLDDDDNVAQWATDMANWQLRLENYKRVLRALPNSQWSAQGGCALAYRLITAPLLSGIWYEELPGIGLNSEEKQRIASGQGHPTTDVTTRVVGKDHPPGHSNAKVPDVIMPFTLGNQVLVYKEHQDERARLFWEDLKTNAKKLLDKVQLAGKTTFWVAVVAAGIVATGGVAWWIMTKNKPKSQARAVSRGEAREMDKKAIEANVAKGPTKRQLARARMGNFDY